MQCVCVRAYARVSGVCVASVRPDRSCSPSASMRAGRYVPSSDNRRGLGCVVAAVPRDVYLRPHRGHTKH